MKRSIWFFVAMALLFSVNGFAYENRDISGARDNPLLSRFQGSVIRYENTVKFDTYIIPVSRMISVGGSKTWKKKLKIGGEVNRIQYLAPADNNSLLVYRNYLSALKKADWRILFSGAGDRELGNDSVEWYFYLFGDEGYRQEKKFGSRYNLRGRNHAYIAAEYEDAGNTYYVVIYIIEKDDATLINQDVIKVKNPDLGLVTAKLMRDRIGKKGHVALDGIFFESGRSRIMEKSGAALKNMAQYLKANPGKRFFVVGHTDNVGGFRANMALSQARAEAVVRELVGKYGVTPGQLEAHGVANLAPMLANTNDAARAKNRRVELVEE